MNEVIVVINVFLVSFYYKIMIYISTDNWVHTRT